MFSEISWNLFFIYIGGALLAYYAFVIFYYYSQELSSFMKKGFSRNDQMEHVAGATALSQEVFASSKALGRARDYSSVFQAGISIEDSDTSLHQNMYAADDQAEDLAEVEEEPLPEEIMREPLDEKESIEDEEKQEFPTLDESFEAPRANLEELEELHISSEKDTLPSEKEKPSKPRRAKPQQEDLFENVNVDELLSNIAD